MTSYVPRRSREVHAESLLRRINDDCPVEFAEGGLVVWGGQDEGEAFIPLRDDSACVCEEPCRYCHCKETP
jgi:hypothetical protein